MARVGEEGFSKVGVVHVFFLSVDYLTYILFHIRLLSYVIVQCHVIVLVICT